MLLITSKDDYSKGVFIKVKCSLPDYLVVITGEEYIIKQTDPILGNFHRDRTFVKRK